MSEMVLVLPFVLLIFSLIVFFGRGVVRLQHASVTDRYEAWRHVQQAPGPYADAARGSPLLNETFFANRAESLEVDGDGWYPDDAEDLLRQAGAAFSVETAHLVDQAMTVLPAGRGELVKVRYANGVPLWERFSGPIRHRHTRLNGDWRWARRVLVNAREQTNPQWPTHNGWAYTHQHVGLSVLGSVRQVFYENMDQSLQTMQNQGNGLADCVRGSYLNEPGYVGPRVEYP